MKVFWDTNLFIYLIERHPEFHPKVLGLYHRHRDQGDEIVTSTLTLGELIAQPLRLGRWDLVKSYTELLTSGRGIQLAGFDVEAAGHYGRIRAETTLRQPDAIQMACALAAGANSFITNDQRLWGVKVSGLSSICGL